MGNKWLLVTLAALAAAGCASQAQFLDNRQAMAMQTATSRGQFEMNCPAATGTILSREVVQPVLRKWNIFERDFGADGAETLDELGTFLEELERQAVKFEEMRDRSLAREAARRGRVEAAV